MGKLPDNFILVPENSPTAIDMDIDVMVRKTIIFLYSVTDKNGNTLGSYDDYYLQLPKDKGIVIDKDQPGAANIFYPTYYNVCAAINFLIGNFIAFIKPINLALELPELLLNPPKLIEKVKELIDLIKGVIKEITDFLTDTKNWIIKKLLGAFANIKLPKEIGDLYAKLLENIDTIVSELMSMFADAKSFLTITINSLIVTLNTQIASIKTELTKLLAGDLANALAKRNEVLHNFLIDFNDDTLYTLDNRWITLIQNINKLSIDDITFINDKFNFMIDDKNTIIKEQQDNYNYENKKLSKMSSTDENYTGQTKLVNDLNTFITQWQNDVNSYYKVTDMYQKLNILVAERQKIVEYYINKKIVLDNLLIQLNLSLVDAKAKLKALQDAIKQQAAKVEQALDAKAEVVKAYINAIIQAILFPFKIIVGVIKSFIVAITGFIINIPNLPKMLEDVIKLVKDITDLINPAKILIAIEKIMITVFDSIKSGLGKVLTWMLNNGGLNLETLEKAIEWCKKNVPEIIEFVQNFLGLIIKIIKLIPFMIETIILAYVNYALKSIPSPVKSVIGLS